MEEEIKRFGNYYTELPRTTGLRGFLRSSRCDPRNFPSAKLSSTGRIQSERGSGEAGRRVGTYRRKLCWDSATAKTRILVNIETRRLSFVVHRKGAKWNWSKGLRSVSPFSDISPPAEFPKEQDAIEFADEVVRRLIENEHFRECPDALDEEFPR
jgi:hypothetical protein